MHIIFAIVKFLFFQADRSKVEITTVNLEESYDSKIFVEWAPLTFWREWLAFFNATWCSKRVRIFCPSGTYPLFCFPSPLSFTPPPAPWQTPPKSWDHFLFELPALDCQAMYCKHFTNMGLNAVGERDFTNFLMRV